MIEFLIGIDGGGSGTRARLARRDASPLAEGARTGRTHRLNGLISRWLTPWLNCRLALAAL